MTNGPERIDFEQRRISRERYESIPRRSSDKRLFARLTPKQQTAFDLIEEGRGYEMAGLPGARMRYHDAPGGHDYELTPRQMQALFDYRDWRKDAHAKAPACHYAVLRYIDGSRLMDIEKALRIRHGDAGLYIAHGLNLYCILKGWGDQAIPVLRRAKMTAYGVAPSGYEGFGYVDNLGHRVAVIDTGENNG